ncbi:putative ATLS1-like light-inducible protein [Thioalkalivibrio nitratireducens DSM 14787]|uniref:L-dopachrome isomerase n=1 Tax=Thioalkalivibrio nitratireducens (strain DSM 14787 / UNIQEM 213 / ALEN2) TaxID=1255043 RepID=L0E1A1_THIND|nr:phenylpyruvate tautomerase MIF-related protein [Thioalkalivibrio nitratireducens]AGA35027.1 putative ATLS1-like light-inducible protein [Thioalkalivibrio nitratireducens DSM 14787]
MPLLSVETNVPLPADPSPLTADLSTAVAQWLGKPEGYVMVRLAHNAAMRFAGTTDPLAYCELKSIGLPEARTWELSEALCSRLQERIGVAPNRIYIEFSDAPRQFWGWNSSTF